MNVVSDIAYTIAVISLFPIIYMLCMNLYRHFKPNDFVKNQQDRTKNKCELHSYTRISTIRVCEDCGFCPETKIYYNTDRIKLQIELNEKIKQLNQKENDNIQCVFEKYNLDKEVLNQATSEIENIKSNYAQQRTKLTYQYIQLSKDKGYDF